jgi:clathrin heavy chain
LEEFVGSPNAAKLLDCGDRVFAEHMYQAARIIYTQIKNFAKLAMALVKLELWQEAVDAARKAKAMPTWKFVCFACADADKFRLAQVCGLNVIGIMEHLMELVAHYEKRGYFAELIQLLEAGINLERTHQGIFTALGTAYAKHKEDKMMEFVKLFHARANMAQLITACRQNLLWPEAVFLSQQYEQYESAVDMMIDHRCVHNIIT